MKKTNWYALQVFTSHEDKVKHTLEAKIALLNKEEDIPEVYVPKKIVYRKRDGKVREAEQKLYPGYVFVNADLRSSDNWHIINDTEGVIGFIGNGILGEPIADSEIEAIKKSVSDTREQPDVRLKVGETVSIKSGPFEGYSGVIEEINIHKLEAVILIDMNGNQRKMIINYESLEN
ncbi:MAG: KOW motif-containing protein [Abditibacteriota bacterium]|nr:KOW motif-containing protein [Abditibacteriota bacterium]